MSPAERLAEEGDAATYLRACDKLLWCVDRARVELREALSRTEAQLVWVPRRPVEQLVGWFDTLEDEEDEECAIKALIGSRIEALIACLDALERDVDLEEDDVDGDDLREAEEVAA